MASRTVYTVLTEAAATRPGEIALHQPVKGANRYTTWTWAEYLRAVQETAVGLRLLGLGKGDIVALDSSTRAEFYFADLGTMVNGSVAAALYTNYPTPDLVRAVHATGAKAVFVEDRETLLSLQETMGPPLDVIWILMTGYAPGVLTLDELRESGRRALAQDPGYLTRILGEYIDEDNAILYQTSGATGEPKMALVSHRALVSNIDMGPAALPLGPEDRALVFLPSAHIAQRVVMELLTIRMSIPVWFSESLAKLPHEMRSVRPTFLLAPPRVWERIYASICAEINRRNPATRKLFYGALGLGLESARLRYDGKSAPAWIRSGLKAADRLVFRKIRARLGGRLRIAASGAAPLARDLAQFYEAIGMPLIEGYGLTEGGVVALNPVESPRAGSIGKALAPSIDIRFAEDGELMVRTPCLFSGYFNDPEATASVLKDGWLYTGDIAEQDAAGFIYITGRKKEIIVSSNGKKIYPSRIEAMFKTEPLINQVVLAGDRMPYIAALFTINAAAARELKGLELTTDAELPAARPLIAELKKIVARVNEQLAPFEQIRKFRVLDRDFTIENGEITPTMKVRRKQVLENFRAAIAELYAGREDAIPS